MGERCGGTRGANGWGGQNIGGAQDVCGVWGGEGRGGRRRAKDQQGFFWGQAKVKEKGTGRGGVGGGDELLCLVCVLVLCVCEEPGKKKGTSGFVGGEVMWGGCSNEVDK